MFFIVGIAFRRMRRPRICMMRAKKSPAYIYIAGLAARMSIAAPGRAYVKSPAPKKRYRLETSVIDAP